MHYDLEADHYKLYNTLAEEQIILLGDGSKIDGTTSQRLNHLLQQIVMNHDYFSGDPKKRSAGYDLLDEVIEQTECRNPAKSKLIIWSYYKRTTEAIMRYLGPSAVAAYSGTDSNASFKRFMEDPSIRFGVFQPLSAGAGLNPQSVCWEMLFLETPTVPLQFIQAAGRVDRAGQKHVPTIRIAIANRTCQVRLHRNLLNNGDLTHQVERSVASLRDMIYGE